MMCYVCVLSTENYLDGVLVLNENLKHFNSKYDLLCLINEDLPDYILEVLDYFGIKYRVCKKIEFKNVNEDNPYWIYTFDKLNVFSLTEFEKIVYLDTDLLITKNVDELFDFEPLSMALDLPFKDDFFNSGVMVIKPNMEDYNNLKALSIEYDDRGEKVSDQDVINDYFKGRINEISQKYNCVRNVCDYLGSQCYDYIFQKDYVKYGLINFQFDVENPYIIHYIGKLKPFMIDNFYDDDYAFLYFYFENYVRKNLTKFFNLVSDDLISVIIPVYNKSEKIRRCLDSVLNQTYGNLEVIVVDDCSTDDSFEICKEYQNMDSRIRLFRNERNMGVSEARNYGLSVMTGNYVGFVDADDYIDSKMYEELMLNIKNYDMDFVQCGYYKNDKEKITSNIHMQNIFPKAGLFNVYLKNSMVSDVVWDKLYRRDIIDGIHFDPNCQKNEDKKFVFQVVKRCDKVGFIGDIYYHYYYMSSGSLTEKFDVERDYSLIEHIHDVEKYGLETGCKEADIFKYMFIEYQYFIGSLSLCEYKDNQIDLIVEVVNEIKNFVYSHSALFSKMFKDRYDEVCLLINDCEERFSII